jgi:hypothetical protein
MLAKPNFQNWLWSARRPLNGLKPHRKSGELQRLYGRSKPRLSGQGWSSSQPMRPRGLACVLSIAPANMPRGAGLGRADKRGLGGQGGGTRTVGRSRGRSEARLAAEPKRPTSQISKRSQLLRRNKLQASGAGHALAGRDERAGRKAAAAPILSGTGKISFSTKRGPGC